MSGRPSAYNEDIAEEILVRLSAGESLRSICEADNMPARSTVMLWVARDREGFSDRYAKACEARAHYWADELLDIADDELEDFQRARLRIDTRKWLLSKLVPKYADKQQLDMRHDISDPMKELLDFVHDNTKRIGDS